MLVAAVVVVAAMKRDDPEATAATAGDVGACIELTGDAARACYRREVGAQLASVAAAPRAVFVQDERSTVTFAADQSAGLLCELHLRAGVTDESKPAWLGWNS